MDGASPQHTAAHSSLVVALLVAAVSMALGYAVRLGLVELPQLAWTCQSVAPPWWCPLRFAAVEGLRFGTLGFAALACGLVAILRGGRQVALAAIGLGAAGLVLYGPEPAAGGALLGAMALLRR